MIDLAVLKAFISGLSAQEKKILYTAIVFVFLAIFDGMILAPMTKESKVLDEKVESKMVQIKKSTMFLQYKDRILNEDTEYGIFYIKKGLTREERIALFLREVEGISKEAKISLININPVESEEKKGYEQYSLTVECMGNMKNFVEFVYKIDNAKKLIRVVSYDLAPKDRNTYDVKATVTIQKTIIVLDETIGGDEEKLSDEKEAAVAKLTDEAPPAQ